MTRIDISAASQPGLVRDHNEDMLLIDTDTYRDTYTQRSFDIDETTHLILAVADGLGGHNAGEVASEDAARELGAHVATLPATLSPDELRTDLEEWFLAEHDYLLREGKADPSKRGMATTIAAVLFYRSHTYLINCGDSRVYLFDTNGLRQLSSDHSLYAVTHSLADAHIITNCLGAGDPPYIDFTDITDLLSPSPADPSPAVSVSAVAPSDPSPAVSVPSGFPARDSFPPSPTLLLCSDGLSDMLTDSEIEVILSENPVTSAAQLLVEATYKAGARDNVSLILATLFIPHNS